MTHDIDDADARFAQRLAALDENLRLGGEAVSTGETGDVDTRLKSAREVLELLHAAFQGDARVDPPRAALPAMRERVGRFVVEGILGEGAFGRVYRARDPVLGRAVALKVAKMRDREAVQSVKRFEREAKALAMLRHPNIVTLFDYGQDGDDFFIALALIPGRTLQEEIARRKNDGTLDPRWAAETAAATGRPQADIDRFLAWRLRQVCAKDAKDRPVWPRNAAAETNISFLFSGEQDAHAPLARRPDGVETPVFRRISARTLMGESRAALPADRVSAEPFAGRFVVIGASHADAHDEHMTPIGKLPGAIIAANAIAGAPAILSAIEVSAFGKTAMALLLFAAFAALSLRFRASVASVVVSLCSLALLPVLGRIFAPSSALEIVFAAIAMLAMFAAIESALEIWQGWREGLGWRVLLKPSKSPKEIA